LLGRYELNKFTEAGFTKSVSHFKRATALDPSFALATAGLAEAYNMLGYWNYLPPKEAFPEAKKAALQALELDPGLAEARTALAFVQYEYDWLFKEAEHQFREAIRLNPRSATARLWFAEFLLEMEQFQEAEEQLERARELDPLSVRISFDVAVKFYWKREFDLAVDQLQKTISMDPDNSLAYDFLSAVFYKKNMPDQAFTASQKAKTLASAFTREEMTEMREAYEAAGLSGYFQKENELLRKRLAQGRYQSPLHIAMNYAVAGANSEALDWLERAVQEHTPWLPELKVEPSWDAVRSHPRFIAALKKIGLEK
jgi:tetratricopeptide (TPR) repeat protein